MIKLYDDEDEKFQVRYKEGVLQNTEWPLNPKDHVESLSALDMEVASDSDSKYMNYVQKRNAQRI